jgi:phosphopantothenoylcysteine decarboxylase
LRAWNPHIPILLAPAMNTQMYTHPITAHHLSQIKQHLPYIEIINPIEKVLACGDLGMGGMAEWGDVVGRVVRKLNLRIRPETESDDENEVDEEEDESETEKDEGEGEEDEEIRAGGEEHEDEKRDNIIREQEKEEEERLAISRMTSRV